jgi:hypothetical protein
MKTRPLLFGIITLIIGFALGWLTSAQLRLNRLKPVRMYFSEERFREGFYRIIQPDEAQKAKIEIILDKYARLNSETQNTFRKELDANIRAMRKELDSNLTRDQLIRLKEMDDRRMEMMKQDRKRYENDSTGFRDERRRPFDRSFNHEQGFQRHPFRRDSSAENDLSRSYDRK